MNSPIIVRRTRVAFAVLFIATLGCGDDSKAVREKHFAELAKYSPEVLSNELVNRLSSIKDNAANYAAKGKADESGEGGGKRAENSKRDPFSIDAVIDDVAKKALTIKDVPKEEVYNEILKGVDASTLDAASKERVRGDLKKAMGL